MTRHIRNKHREVFLRDISFKESKEKLSRDDSNLGERENAEKQIFYIKEIDKIVAKEKNTQDNKALESKYYGNKDYVSDVDETEESVTLTEAADLISDRRNRSWTRKYYHKVNNNLLECTICKRILYMNIHRHIKNKHPDIYSKENPTIGKPSVEEELRIKNICKNIAADRTRPPKSCFWNFFEMTEQDRVYKCSFCQKSLSIIPKSVYNLRRHIAKVHTAQYQIILKYENPDNLIALAASGVEVPGLSSIEISFVCLDDDAGKFECSRCHKVIECTEEESDSMLVDHVQQCELNKDILEGAPIVQKQDVDG